MAEVLRPQIADDELLVRVYGIGVGIHDSYFLPQNALYPYVIGIEAAGVIEQTGGSVTGYQPGDRIAFVSSMQPKGGTWAQFAAVSAASLIIPIPSGMDFVTAAAIPVAGNTVLRALSALSAVPSGGSLFIAGGSGAIGTLGIQLARQRGWRVGASASAANHDYMIRLGVEKAVDYHDPDWARQLREWMPSGVDAAMAIQPGATTDALRVVKDGGQAISISGDAPATERGIRIESIPYQADVRGELMQLMSEVAAGHVHVELEQVHRFEDALAALAKVQTRHAKGKRVLRVA
ncbi:MAG: NADP-dependent oxidoreductase [Actinomycetota bacterium]